jgi:ATP-dependent Clp protease ATP-binding subunit ClpC
MTSDDQRPPAGEATGGRASASGSEPGRPEAAEEAGPTSSNRPGLDGGSGADGLAPSEDGTPPAADAESVSVLEGLGVDLTEVAAGREVLGKRDLWPRELTRVKEILGRRDRHAVVLVGPDGVGKRALVLALARHIAAGSAPKQLRGRRIIELPFHRVLGSVRQSGDFERLVFSALREAGSRDDTILYLSQITSFMGVIGGQRQFMNASYAIEMACQQPGLYLLGSASPQLYAEALGALPWCGKVMTRIEVPEPSREASVAILGELMDELGEYHGLPIDEDAVRAAVELSSDYLHDRVLPGKAFELLDLAASKAATAVAVGAAAGASAAETVALDANGATSVTAAHVTEALSDWVGIPPDKLAGPARRDLLELEERLSKRIKGQDRCIRKVADVIRVAKLGLDAGPSRPNGVFLFVGPTGVGKSELARALSEELYGGAAVFFQFNMARYSDDDGVARLIGLQLGDVDYRGELSAVIARNPHCVIAFEHIERSHRDVAVLLMQIFREGVVVDGHGTKLHFSNSTIIMTTNSDALVPSRDDERTMGFGQVDRDANDVFVKEAKGAIERFFPPDFMDGIDEVLLFDPLSEAALGEIVELHLNDIRERLAERSVSLDVSDDAVSLMVEKGHSREYGARNLGRTVEALVLKPLARCLLAHPRAARITAKAVEGDIEVDVAG